MTLSILIWVPAAFAVLGLLVPARAARLVALVGSLVTLAIAISFLARFHAGRAGLQFVTDDVWISTLGIHYKLGLDGLNVVLVVLTPVIFTAAVLYAATREWERPNLFYFHLGLAQSVVLGAFCAQDLALFVGFFDLMLIPFYFLCGMWGSRSDDPAAPDRVRATTKLVIYTLVGSFFMLVGAIALGVLAASEHNTPLTFVLSALRGLPLSHTSQVWIFLCFAIAFAVKMPLVPFHGWLPDAYKAMPIPVVAAFSAVLSKVAAYGFLRIVLPLLPYASVHFQTLMLVVAVVSILWGTLEAFTTPDARLVVAYSSIAQLSFITLGIFSLRTTGAQGALLQMVNHALVTAPAFFIVGVLSARARGSERLADMGGLAFRAPVLAGLFLIVVLATLAMPGSSNFVGEFMILLGTFQSKLVFALVASVGVVGAAVYALRLYIRSMHNRVGPEAQSREIGRELVAVAPVVVVILVLAFYPQFGLRRSEASVRAALAGTVPQQVQPGGPRRIAQVSGGSVTP